MPPSLCLMLLWIGGVAAARIRGSSELLNSLNHFEVVHVSSVVLSEQSKHTLSAVRTSPSKISFKVNTFGVNVSVDLQRNDMLFHPNYHEIDEQWKNGMLISRKRIDLAEVEACHYQGTSQYGDKSSFAAISNCKNAGFDGVFHANNELYSITPAHRHMSPQSLREHATRIYSTLGEKPETRSLHIIFRVGKDMAHSHVEASCGVTHEDEENYFSHIHHALGDFFGDVKGRHKGLQTFSGDLFIELLVVNDHTRFERLAGNTQTDAAALTNQVDLIYIQSNNAAKLGKTVRVLMTSQITFSAEDPYAAQQVYAGNEVDHTKLIDLFHSWRTSPGNTPAHDNGMLYSGLDFKGGTVGFAGVGSMCAPQASGGIIQTTANFNLYLTGAIIAHELGHNFGMAHDSSNNNCPQSGFVMNAVLNSNPDENVLPLFSDCSAVYFKSFTNFMCLQNQPTTSGLTPQCQNGFIEAGEECDCGTAVACQDPCCNATSCMLLPGAQCSNDQPCCNNCQVVPRSANQVCREAQSTCDVPELCTGSASTCPSDNYKGPGTTCTDSVFGAGLCYSGFCASANRDCSKVGASGYVSCNQGNSCGNLQCSLTGSTPCNVFESVNDAGGGKMQVSDGTPCGSAMQCSSGTCVSSERLNKNYHWSYGPWEPCFSCGSIQTRPVTCQALTTISDGVTSYQQNLTASEWMCSPTTRLASRSCVNITLDCPLPNGNYLTDKARQIAEEYGAINKAQQLRDLVPRLYGPEEFSADDPEYWKGIILMGLIPLLIGIVCLIWCIGHYTSGCGCGDAAPDPAGYSKSQRFVPWIILVSLCVVGLIFACIAQYYNSELHRGITDSDIGAVALIDAIIQDALDLAANLDVPLRFITLRAASILNDVLVAHHSLYNANENATLDGLGNAAVASADQALLGTNQIVSTLANYSTLTIPGQGGGADLNLTCGPCGPIMTAFNSATIEAQNTPLYSLVEQMQSVESLLFEYNLQLTLVEDEFVNVRNKSNELRAYLNEKQTTLDDYKNQVLSAEKVRFPFTLIIFGLPFAFTLMSFIGFFGMSSCFKHQGIVAWSMLVLLWPLMGAHLSLAMTFGDSCVYMDTTEDSIAAGASSGRDPIEAASLQACLADTSIIDALNLTRSFTPPIFSLPSSFATPQLDAALQVLQNLTTQDLGFTSAMQTTYDNTIGQTLLTPPITKAQLETASGDSDPDVAAAAQVCLTIWVANETVIADLANLQSKGLQVSADLAAVSAPLAQVQTILSSIDEDLQPLADACEDMKNLAYCGSLSSNYRVFKDTWCNVITTAFSFLALSCFILGIFSGTFVYLSVMLAKRFGLKRVGRSAGKYKDDEAQMVAVERGNRRERRAARQGRRRDSDGAAG